MRFLPIMDELLSSDMFIMLFAGIVLAIVAGAVTKGKKSSLFLLISLGIYIVCELLANIRTNYMVEIIVLLIGTLALGAAVGFLLITLIWKIRKQK